MLFLEVDIMPTEKDYKVIEKATIYDLRRLIKNSDKDTYTKRELCDHLDTIADAKDQEKSDPGSITTHDRCLST